MMEPLTNPFVERFASIRNQHPLTLSSRSKLRLQQRFFRVGFCASVAVSLATFSAFGFWDADRSPIERASIVFLHIIVTGFLMLVCHLSEVLYLRWRLRREHSSLLTYFNSDVALSLARQLCDFYRQPLPARILESIPHTRVWLVDNPEKYARELLDDDLEVRIEALRKVLDSHGPGLTCDIQSVNDMVAMKHQVDASAEKQERITRLLHGSTIPPS